MAALFELAANFRALADKLNDSELDAQTIADTLDGESGDLEEKAINIAKYSKNLKASAKARRDAAGEMLLRATAEETKADSLESYLKNSLEQAGKLKIDSPWFVISIKKKPASVQIDDESLIPDDYMREIPVSYAPDKKLMKSAMDEGYQIPGAHLARGTRLEIK